MYDTLVHARPIALSTPPPIDFTGKDVPPGPLYLRQQRTVEVIQLIEVEAPPPQQPASDFASSSASSSSSSCSSGSESAASETCETSESEESESVCTSYCSSDEEEMKERKIMFYDDTYGTRLNRVLAWRDSFAKSMGIADTSSYTPLSALQKRKVDYREDPFDDDSSSSHSSKRSRSHSPEPEPQQQHQLLPPPRHMNPWTHRRLSAHSCPACDESFTTRQHLQQHGQDTRLSDACRVAVEYGLEA
ncbi:hypothetical protein BXZ70DRAFT_672571 [Cristinia sonorae]|uniref:Uncharacterized protein n=1 Tax=Cristinia sonorae TaxID=1940300 RepID=A0A8K0XSM2_9AGAR|nr:hypothetical protein BXZ70DRAFT_672571 [Cristinia sonorae]